MLIIYDVDYYIAQDKYFVQVLKNNTILIIIFTGMSREDSYPNQSFPKQVFV